jgi:hypothetical protein
MNLFHFVWLNIFIAASGALRNLVRAPVMRPRRSDGITPQRVLPAMSIRVSDRIVGKRLMNKRTIRFVASEHDDWCKVGENLGQQSVERANSMDHVKARPVGEDVVATNDENQKTSDRDALEDDLFLNLVDSPMAWQLLLPIIESENLENLKRLENTTEAAASGANEIFSFKREEFGNHEDK